LEIASSSIPEAEPSLSPHWHSSLHRAAKRLLDLGVGIALCVLLSPLFLLLAVVVKLSSPGEIFYRWKVVGRGGKPFLSYKFRSMFRDADERKPALEAANEMTGPVFKITNDPRITRAGKWMRRYSLDELPQLYSVLQGNMSLVGPRPPLAAEYRRFTDFQKKKLSVKPGMTGLWQIGGRNQINDLDRWVGLDLEYIRRWSLALDLKILFRTIAVVFSGSGK
jgi:lipopolysaccharide/colanic/teichoic acid biosynthesis glycosyltransferase